MRVSDLMSRPAITALPEETIETGIRRMLRARIGSVIVVDAHDTARPVGIVTRSDLQVHTRRVPRAYPDTHAPLVLDEWVADDAQLLRAYRAIRDRALSEAMRAPPITISAEATPWDAAELMLAHRVGHLPVVEDARLVGVLTRLDFLRCVLEDLGRDPASRP